MITLPGYSIQEQIFDGKQSLIFKAKREKDNLSVILKLLKNEYPSTEDIARFKQEYDITAELKLDGVINIDTLEKYQNSLVMIMEDTGGESLNHFLKINPRLNIDQFFRISIRLAKALGEIHKQQIIHKAMNPSNIIWNPKTDVVKIIDFGLSTKLSKETPGLQSLKLLEDSIAYLSPEQTGRMNRSIDYRTDMYTLGVVFYQILTGQLPFEETDLLELVHCHIARQPVKPELINSDIPSTLSEIVMKLMSKKAEDRYQSAFGLEYDLKSYRDHLNSSNSGDFTLGLKDISDRLEIPQNLYGREEESKKLIQAFERVSQGESELMLVSGYAGIGKTALIQEVHPVLLKKHGNFISGKYDQFKREIPYSALIQAFQELIRQILSEGPDILSKWKEKLLSALGDNSQVVTDVIPELAHIIGKSPDLIELEPNESKNRFNLVFRNFIQVFASDHHPLILFLDDLQWADRASLQLIDLFLADTRSLLVIGAFRDNEVESAHPLTILIQELEKEKRNISHITLEPLKEVDVNRLIMDTFKRDKTQSKHLADLCLKKTQGNPFFLGRLLLSLFEENLINLEPTSGKWTWDIKEIEQVEITDNVIDMMIKKINTLSETSREIMKLAACIGNHFDLHTLASASNSTHQKTLTRLWEPMEEGLIIPLDDHYKFIEETSELTAKFKFLHDRVQQAAYGLINIGDLPEIHLGIGRLLTEVLGKKQLENRIFEVVSHLNLGIDHIKQPKEKNKLTRFNLLAGNKAIASTAYKAALTYLNKALKLLDENSWETNYQLTLDLHDRTAEAAYLAGDYKKMDQLIQVGIIKAKNLLNQIKLYEIKFQSGIAKDQLKETFDTAVTVLNRLGVKYPKRNSMLKTIAKLFIIRHHLRYLKSDQILENSTMQDQYKIAAMKILASFSLTAIIISKDVFITTLKNMVDISLKYGNSKYTPESLVMLGFIFCGSGLDIRLGVELGKTSIKLVNKINAYDRKCKVSTVYNCYVTHFSSHLRETLKPLKEAYLIGLETGEEYYHLAFFVIYYHKFLLGHSIDEIINEFKNNELALKNSKLKNLVYIYQIYFQVLLNLSGRSNERYHLIGEVFDENHMVSYLLEINERTSIITYYRNKAVLCYIFGNYQLAILLSDKSKEYLHSVIGSTGYVMHFFYDSLYFLVEFNKMPFLEKRKILRRVARNQRKMKKWAKHAPMNYRHKYLLVEAERSRAKGKKSEAMKLYDEAIKLARENEYLQEEALANEVAGRFYLNEGRTQIARTYLTEAMYLYDRWGAKAKVEHLKETYPELLSSSIKSEDTLSTVEKITKNHDSSLDQQAVMKASQAISGEIRLGQLIKTLLKITLETAGAQQGFIFSNRDGQPLLEAEGSGSPLEIKTFDSLSIEEREDLPIAVIRYVFKTGETILLNDACNEGDFVNNPYIISHKPQSILCAPIQSRGKIASVIYLENRLSTKAFPPERMEVLNVLFSQAAVSLENARLYQTTEKALEVEKIARKKQEQADRLKDEFLANTSHELRTPLHGIIGLTEAISNRLQTKLDTPDQQDLNTIISSGKRLSNLVDDILDFSRLKHGDLEIDLQPINIKACVDVVFQLSSHLIGHKQLKLINTIPENLPPAAADENRLQQILHNLIGNAIKFSDQGHIEVSAARKERMLEISVSDTGIGIPASEIDRIFNKFEQLDGSMTRKKRGTGLGLAITRKLIEAQGGTIKAESTENRGTILQFTLPVAKNLEAQPTSINRVKSSEDHSNFQVQQVPSTVNHEQSKSVGTYSILAVDDDPVNLRVVDSQLSGEQYIIYPAVDGLEALKWIEKNGKPDLILLDIMMPTMSGFELCQKIREEYPAFELPIIFLTAKNQISDLVEGFSMGANDYLTKPFTRDELLSRVQNQLKLLQTGNKLISLRKISHQLGKLKDSELMMTTVFKELTRILDISQGVLFFEEESISSFCHGKNESSIIKYPPTSDTLEKVFSDNEEVIIYNSMESSNSLHQYCSSQLGEETRNSHWILIRINGFEEYLFCLYRQPGNLMYTSVDAEYTRSLIHEVKTAKQNLGTLAIDVKFNQILVDVASYLNEILYIQGGKGTPYCDIILDNPDTPQLTLRISLQKLQTFFPETTLLRIHKSYLVNPNKIDITAGTLQPRGKREFDLILKTADSKNLTCPVSRQYIAKIRKLYL